MSFNLTTFLLELVNFVVLAWLLTRFVYRPIAQAIQDRRDELATTRAEAARRLAEVDARAVTLGDRARELDRLRENIFAAATTEAAAERARLLAQARDDAAAERERVQGVLEAEREAAVAWVREAAVDRGTEVAGHLLLALAPEAAHQALLDRLIASVKERGDTLKGPSGEAPQAELSLARAAPPAAQEALRAALAEALGQPPRLILSEDAALGAGAVLRVGDRVLDASVSGQLDLLRHDARMRLEEG